MKDNEMIILPIHLFNINILSNELDKIEKKISIIYIIEEPVYFGDRDIKLNFNKLKLIYHRATLRYYYAYLLENLANKNIKIKYVEYNELLKDINYKKIFKGNIFMFEITDTYCETKYKGIFKDRLNDYLISPLFLNSLEDLKIYHNSKKNKNVYFHNSFYQYQKKRLNILTNTKSYDKENRLKMPETIKIPELPINNKGNKYVKEAIIYVNTKWANNLEPIYVKEDGKKIIEENILFPIDHMNTIKWLKAFCVNRFEHFGKYEDSIVIQDDIAKNFVFHSCITPMLNIGLITPHEIITIITEYYNKHNIHISNYEGYIRQIIGWREYQRYIYIYAGEKMKSSNIFNNQKHINGKWYNATTNIKPLDDTIKLAMNHGYIHHILRLMVICNLMNLIGIHPHDAYKWFMEFSLDSYDWVMIGNVYSMGLWADGGLTMRKPYICSDNYIMKMSNYKKDTWNKQWSSLFNHFINNNTAILSKTYYKNLVTHWHKQPSNITKPILSLAQSLINNITL